MKFERLFSPIKIGNLEIKNRVVMPALNTLYVPDGFDNDRFNYFYWRRAEGGVGLIIVGGAVIDDYGATYSMISLADDKFIPGFKKFTDGVHERGAKVGVQLFQAGRYGYSSVNGGNVPIAPSAVYSGYSRETPREMTKEDIRTVIEKGAEAALRAKKAGFDLVEISGSAGYLICQFLSPYTNLRTDEYGGSWANRVRFPKEFFRAVRKAVGEDYPLGIRISGHDLVPGSNTNEDAVRFSKVMEEAGADYINVTGGWHESKVPQITAELPRGGFDFLAAEIRKAVSIPVILSNRVNDPEVAERVLATGAGDMVSLGRPHIADPDWCRKAEAGEEKLIRHCLGCNQGCLARAFFNKPIECLVNGQAGREYRVKDVRPADPPKKILVIGGGPAGCEFAIRSAQQGNEVTLWEKDGRIGGHIEMVARPPHKEEFLTLITYFENMLGHENVKVELGKEATLDEVKKGGFDLVVTAMGRGEAPKIPLRVTDDTPVCSYDDILLGRVMAGENVVVIGGGTVGCETAEYMACEASVSPEQVYHMMAHRYQTPEEVYRLIDTCRRNITIVDMAKIGQGFEAGTAWPVMKNFKRYGVKQYAFSSVDSVGGGRAELTVPKIGGKPGSRKITVPCDTVVLAVGARPNDALFNELKAAGIPAENIGDSKQVKNILTGIREACELSEKMGGVEPEG
ncbi:MAG: FAD-dependent oxidoreductase [Anaerovoracaceae bacterium]|jgi:2,4-dienoyl-CoA reductase (NADPH2)